VRDAARWLTAVGFGLSFLMCWLIGPLLVFFAYAIAVDGCTKLLPDELLQDANRSLDMFGLVTGFYAIPVVLAIVAHVLGGENRDGKRLLAVLALFFADRMCGLFFHYSMNVNCGSGYRSEIANLEIVFRIVSVGANLALYALTYAMVRNYSQEIGGQPKAQLPAD
jgi:hypothetical protein